jgi:hypothetical protein
LATVSKKSRLAARVKSLKNNKNAACAEDKKPVAAIATLYMAK